MLASDRGRISSAVADYPVEFDELDRELVRYIFSNRLTMVGKERLISTVMACKYVCSSAIEGDFVECGVWRGGNSIVAADVFKRAGSTKVVYLYDTFAGMSAPTVVDEKIKEKLDTRRKFVASQNDSYNDWCYASLDEVKANFAKVGLLQTAKFVEGDVLETLNDQSNLPDKISVLRLDTDWYEFNKERVRCVLAAPPAWRNFDS